MSFRSLNSTELITVDLARSLRAAGLQWRPTAGDRFVIADRDMDTEVFVVSDMVADLQDHPTGQVIGFNGTVEWALDSVGAEQALWLPGEDQLRRLLGGTFQGLRRDAEQWTVTIKVPGRPGEDAFAADTAVHAYGLALQALLASVTD